MSKKTPDQIQAIEYLREALTPGQRVYTVMRSVNRDGTARRISVLIATGDDGIRSIDYLIHRAGIFRTRGDKAGLYVQGGGMDMGHHVVYTLGRAVFPDGVPCSGYQDTSHRCRSNDHSNEQVAQYNLLRIHSDGGYAFSHNWL